MTPEQTYTLQKITDIIATKRANKTAPYICLYISDLKCCDKKVINELIQQKKYVGAIRLTTFILKSYEYIRIKTRIRPDIGTIER